MYQSLNLPKYRISILLRTPNMDGIVPFKTGVSSPLVTNVLRGKKEIGKCKNSARKI